MIELMQRTSGFRSHSKVIIYSRPQASSDPQKEVCATWSTSSLSYSTCQTPFRKGCMIGQTGSASFFLYGFRCFRQQQTVSLLHSTHLVAAVILIIRQRLPAGLLSKSVCRKCDLEPRIRCLCQIPTADERLNNAVKSEEPDNERRLSSVL